MYTKLKNCLSQLSKIGKENAKNHENECKKYALLGSYCDKRSQKLVEFFNCLADVNKYRFSATNTSTDLEKLNSAIELRALSKDLNQWGETLKFLSDKSVLKEINDKMNTEGFDKYFLEKKGDSFDTYKEKFKASPDGYPIWEKANDASHDYFLAEERKNNRKRFIAPVVLSIFGAIGGALLAFSPLSPFDIDTEFPARATVFAGLAGVGYGLGVLFEKLDRKIKEKRKIKAWKNFDKAIQPFKEKAEEACKKAKAEFIKDLDLPEAMPALPTFNKYLLPVVELFYEASNEILTLRSLNGLGEYSAEQLTSICEYLKNGRADTLKEALNLYLTDQKIQLGFQILQQQQDELQRKLLAEKQANTALLTALASFVKAESKKNEAILESQKNLQQTLNEINEEEKRKIRLIEIL